jgi:hypothetical protein
MKQRQNKNKFWPAVSASSQSTKKAGPCLLPSPFLGSDTFYYIVLAFFVLAISIIRWRLAGMPLERDEGEYAYFGHLILNGVAPYTDAYNMKLPGIYYMYALIMSVFGESYRGIHIGCLVMNAGTMLLLYHFLKSFFNSMTGVVAAGTYGFMAMSYNFSGSAAHATHFAVFYVALSLFFFSQYEQKKTILLAILTGGMLGMAFLMKQQAVYFILFGGTIFLVFEFLEKPISIPKIALNTFLFSGGVCIPYFLVLLLVIVNGTFDKFWFWTVEYASKYVSRMPWSQGKELLAEKFGLIWDEFIWICILAIAGALIILLKKFSYKQKIFTLAFAVFAFLATTPGFFFREHYFIVFLPAVALLAAITLDYAGQFITKQFKIKALGLAFPLVILFLIFTSVTAGSPFFYLTDDPAGLCKKLYGTNPFEESIEIAKYIKAHSTEKDQIAVLGSEPQIPFYAGRRSATGHIYTYGLMEIHEYNIKMQEVMTSEIEKNKPLFMVFCNMPFSWLAKDNSPMRIFDWYEKYSRKNYEVVGLVDIPDEGPSMYYWDADAQRNPKNKNCVWVLKRKEETKN